VRAELTNRKTVEDFFFVTKETTQELGTHESPEQLFNMDKTGLPLNNGPGKIVAQRGIKCREVVKNTNV
jgi:hypothetical protein